ncbi:nuclear transport factor 2 family protein [Jejuia pallidilutea]|nr:nuclear transport factor 2 family protein [Jejuia pallidilutea]
MKKVTIIGMILLTCIVYSQTKKNGTIYLEHPAITIAEQAQQAFIKGDTTKLKSLLAENFKAYNGMNANPDNEGTDKKTFLRQSSFWKNNASYLSIERYPGAYPDALEYKKDNKDDKIWVQTWDMLKGVHNATGVKLNMPLHRLFVINKDNKIETIITYDDGAVFQTLRAGFSTRTNGKLYDQHENINTVRKMVASLEHGDADKAFSYFTEDATFSNLDMPNGETKNLEEEKEDFLMMLTNWDIESIDVRGYPDYLEYEIGNGKVVQSWWDFRVKRKSDGKKINIPVLLIHDFNDEGKIINETGYYTVAAMMEK